MEKYEFVKIEYTTTFTTEDCNFEHNFSEGLCPVQIKRSEKWIFVNEKGEMAFDGFFLGARPFSEGLALVKNDLTYDFINTKGETVFSIPLFTDDDYVTKIHSFENGYAVVEKKSRILCNYTFAVIYDKKGKAVKRVHGKYQTSYGDGLFCVNHMWNGRKYGYVNMDGLIVIPYIYDEAHAFHDGCAQVSTWKDGKYYIDKTGKRISRLPKKEKVNNSKWRKTNINGQNVLVDRSGNIFKLNIQPIKREIIISHVDVIPEGAKNIKIKSYVCHLEFGRKEIDIEKEDLQEYKLAVAEAEKTLRGYSIIDDIHAVVAESQKQIKL